MTRFIRPKSNKQTKVIRAMTLDEENQFVNYLQTKTIDECPYKNEYLIQLFMGLRVGECLALDVHDIDLMNRKIYIHKTLTSSSGDTIKLSNSPKTQAGNRYLPIPDSLYPYIVEQMRYCDSDIKLLSYLFCTIVVIRSFKGIPLFSMYIFLCTLFIFKAFIFFRLLLSY